MQGTTKHCYMLNTQALALVVLEKNIFFPITNKPIADIDTPRAWSIWTLGHSWQDL